MNRNLPAFALCCVLAACASEPLALSYYVLLPATTGTSEAAAERPAVLLERIELAEFLQQSGLVIQSGANELLVSRSHLWAESLDSALPKALLAALQESPDFRFFLQPGEVAPAGAWRVRIRVDSFHATAAGEVVASGRYQLVDGEGRPVTGANFRFVEDLTDDGFPHAVSRMQLLVRRMAQDLLHLLQALDAEDRG